MNIFAYTPGLNETTAPIPSSLAQWDDLYFNNIQTMQDACEAEQMK